MDAPFPVCICDDAVGELLAYCRSERLDRHILVADDNTYAALGRRVEGALTSAGMAVERVLLDGPEVIADGHRILQALLPYDGHGRTYLAVGSGTVTDVARFASHRVGAPFISLPTAPSVDGYASVNAPLVVGRYKRTVPAQGPLALFADLPTLCAAPRAMIAAGVGDVLGKFTSLADWRLGHLVWDEPYDTAIAGRTRAALERVVEHIDEIGAARPEGIRALMVALIDSGVSMLRFGDSRPASGAEHHLSHYWEMRLLLEGRPAVLHGAKVGVATVRIAALYGRIRAMDPAEARERLEATPPPDPEERLARLRAAYGPAAGQVIEHHGEFLELRPARLEALKGRVAERWEAIRAIAGEVPPPEEVERLLRVVGGPTTPEALGLHAEEAEASAHYLRARLTVLKLAGLLGLLPW